MISIGVTRYDSNTIELPQLILNGTKRQACLTHQLAHIPAVVRVSEQRPQNLRSHFWEQNIQQPHLGMNHALAKLDCFKQSSLRREQANFCLSPIPYLTMASQLATERVVTRLLKAVEFLCARWKWLDFAAEFFFQLRV